MCAGFHEVDAGREGEGAGRWRDCAEASHKVVYLEGGAAVHGGTVDRNLWRVIEADGRQSGIVGCHGVRGAAFTLVVDGSDAICVAAVGFLRVCVQRLCQR